MVVVVNSGLESCSDGNGRTWEAQVPHLMQETAALFWGGISVRLLLGLAHSFWLYQVHQFGLSVLPVDVVGTFWCLFPLLRYISIFFLVCYEIVVLALEWSRTRANFVVTHWQICSRKHRIWVCSFITLFCHPFPRDWLALLNWDALCNSHLMLELPVTMWKS